MKKILKITGISILIVLILLIAAPFVFKSQINDLVKKGINSTINAKVEFSSIGLSFLSSFPKAKVNINDLQITTLAPFENQNLATIKSIAFTMPIKELFKDTSKSPMAISSIHVNEAKVNLQTDKQGNVNYDIGKTSEQASTESTTKSPSTFSIDIKDYSVSNSDFTYVDALSKTTFYITELNHSGKGLFSGTQSELDTHTDANVSFSSDSTNYLDHNPITLDARIGLDLDHNKYIFKNNTAFINQLPLHFEGAVQLLDNGQDIDITFENPESSFKDFLALIPKTYSKDLAGVETSGDFKVKGSVKGLSSDQTIPNIDISIVSNNAAFKYPDLPKGVKDISINTSIINTTGNVDQTYVEIKTLNFKIDQDVFKSSAVLKNLTSNMQVNSTIDGTLNLANITKAYPISLDKELSGILKANVRSNFDLNAIETNAYNRIKNEGNLTINNFSFSSEELPNTINIDNADIDFNPSTVLLNNLSAKTGDSDFKATGELTNLLGFLLSDKTLQGDFNLKSDHFVLSDFMVQEQTDENTESTSTTNTEALKIPSFLDCNINAEINTVVYDNLNLKNLKGRLNIKDQQATLSNLTTNVFDGKLAINGSVATSTDTPLFDLALDVSKFDISKSFKGLEMLQKIAPIASILDGKLNTIISLSGALTPELTPDLNTLSGKSSAEILTSTISAVDTELLSTLGSSLNFIDFNKLQLKDLKTRLAFDNGTVQVKPFKLKYDDIPIEVSGSHGFDKSLAYTITFDVPTKYLGSEVNKLISNINDSDIKQLSVPVTASIGGSYTKPSIKTDLKTAIGNLTQQLVEIKKQQLLNKGKAKVTDLIGSALGGKKTDSTKTKATDALKDPIKDGAKNLLNNLFNKKKKKRNNKQ